MPNQLRFEKSPYLLQHQNNPVDWLPWGKAAFERARQEDKPVFLSIGYSTCHWCHVMAHESFEDEETAQSINSGFIPIKVDREERPDVDAVYMAACMAITGSGGWPLTVLLTPDQKPFWAGTYLPKHALLALLDRAKQLWREDRANLLTAGDQLTAHLRREETTHPSSPDRKLAVQAVRQYSSIFDREWGGFGQPPKFPTPHNLLFLLRYSRITGDKDALSMVQTTLDSMYRGGLFDHVGGGFSRYSTDRRWLVPHFEKMLYDNALLALTYTEAYQHTGRPLYAAVARRTLDYVLRELSAPQGGFCCGQDADSEGVEGKYYVFTPAEIRTPLDKKDATLFCLRYGITDAGNFEGKSIPNLIGQPDLDQDPERMEAIRQRLSRYRLERTALHRDDKVLTSWNGLIIAALAKAGLALKEPRYRTAAEQTVEFITKNLTGRDGRLLARWRDGQAAFYGKLEDYAFYAWGLLELYGATLRIRYLEEAQRLAGLLLDYFFDPDRGGLYPYPSDGEQLLTRSKEMYDGATPSGNAVAALVFSRLARLTGEKRWRESADLQLAYLTGAIQDQPIGHGFGLVALLEELWPTAELVCTAQEEPQELLALLAREAPPGLTVLLKTPESQDVLAKLAPFTQPYPIPDQGARYYLCRNGACAQPVDSIEQLQLLWAEWTAK